MRPARWKKVVESDGEMQEGGKKERIDDNDSARQDIYLMITEVERERER